LTGYQAQLIHTVHFYHKYILSRHCQRNWISQNFLDLHSHLHSLWLQFTDNVHYCIGWGAAADIAKRVLIQYKSPKKRIQVSTMLTIDQVSNAFCKTDSVHIRWIVVFDVLDYFQIGTLSIAWNTVNIGIYFFWQRPIPRKILVMFVVNCKTQNLENKYIIIKNLSWCWQTLMARSKVNQGHRLWHHSIVSNCFHYYNVLRNTHLYLYNISVMSITLAFTVSV